MSAPLPHGLAGAGNSSDDHQIMAILAHMSQQQSAKKPTDSPGPSTSRPSPSYNKPAPAYPAQPDASLASPSRTMAPSPRALPPGSGAAARRRGDREQSDASATAGNVKGTRGKGRISYAEQASDDEDEPAEGEEDYEDEDAEGEDVATAPVARAKPKTQQQNLPAQQSYQQQQGQQQPGQPQYQGQQEPRKVQYTVASAGAGLPQTGIPVRVAQQAESMEEYTRTRKDNHKEVERRRRETINEGINELKKIVPGCEKNKGSILQRAVQYIQQLKEAEASNIEKWTLESLLLQQGMGELKQENDALRQMEGGYEEMRQENEMLRRRVQELEGGVNGRGGGKRGPEEEQDDPAKRARVDA
ncbi:hypothetical protein MNV49_006276 [Pseudohyphozyma bogoriensis]|nr:hypothetical protein MNV49_006276 [Pseudohyphozyma bogoriensis]